MILLAIVLIVVLFFVGRAFIKDFRVCHGGTSLVILFLVLTVVIGFLVFTICGMTGTLIYDLCAPNEWLNVGTSELVSLKDNSVISGNFFLGCGTISGSQHYFFYKKTDRGGFVLNNVSTYQTEIFEEERTNGELKVLLLRYCDGDSFVGKIRKIGILPVFPEMVPKHYRYEIRVPKGTIIREFKLN
jgi:hypothetical protein